MEELESVQQELRATQEMLFLVLDAVGEPVEVNKKKMTEVTIVDRQIQINENDDAFVFSIGVVGD